MTKDYTNGELTVHWQPEKCIHSARCIRGLPAVFHAKQRPWITMDGATTEEIMRTVDTCPSGALSYTRHNAEPTPAATAPAATAPAVEIRMMKNGPLLVKGVCRLVDDNGNEISTTETFALCRCGASGRKPFCDSTHKLIGFQG